MHVNRMLPPAGIVLEDPLLHGIALNRKTWGVGAGANEFSVHLPLTVASLEPEGASDTRSVIGVGETVEIGSSRNRCRVNTVIGYNRTIDDDLEYLVSLTSAQNIARGAASVL